MLSKCEKCGIPKLGKNKFCAAHEDELLIELEMTKRFYADFQEIAKDQKKMNEALKTENEGRKALAETLRVKLKETEERNKKFVVNENRLALYLTQAKELSDELAQVLENWDTGKVSDSDVVNFDPAYNEYTKSLNADVERLEISIGEHKDQIVELQEENESLLKENSKRNKYIQERDIAIEKLSQARAENKRLVEENERLSIRVIKYKEAGKANAALDEENENLVKDNKRFANVAKELDKAKAEIRELKNTVDVLTGSYDELMRKHMVLVNQNADLIRKLSKETDAERSAAE